MQTLTIDLKKNPEVANLVSGMEPGKRIVLQTSIKANDDQTLTLTLESAEAGGEDVEVVDEDAQSEDDDDNPLGRSLAPDAVGD